MPLDLGILKTLEPESYIAVINISEINPSFAAKVVFVLLKIKFKLIP